MAKYVKFLRGTPAAYNNLAHKDSDTLYFIYEEDESSAELYLGTKLIAGFGSNENSNIRYLSDLKDVFINENLTDASFLVYDAISKNWINKALDELFFVGATDLSSGIGGLVPPPEAGQNDLFLKSDGTWSTPEINHIVLTIENKNNINHSDIISEATENFVNTSGDIIIIKDLIYNEKWQYTGYVFDDNEWHAMDGNYNAENVYFSQDLITTTEIGNIILTNGKATIAAAGKNLKQVFEEIFVDEKEPIINAPSITVNLLKDSSYEVGKMIDVSYKAIFDPGQYSYGPATGVTVTSWSITDSLNNNSTLSSGSFNNIIVTDDFYYKIDAIANYSEGSIPVTNLGNEYLDGQIVSGSTESTSLKTITGYRNSFYGTLKNKDILTSDIIRGLSATNRSLVPGEQIIVNISPGALSTIFAYPASLPDLISITDANALSTQILSSFDISLIKVAGADGYNAIDYKVYRIDYANPYDTSNYYTFTIGEEG